MGRTPCCDKNKVKRGQWSPDEDEILKNYLLKHGTGGNWITLPLRAGLKRCGKSCRLRWLNYLRPDIKLGNFTQEEDNIICSLYTQLGSRWSIIASKLPGRTDNDVKNYWNTKLKKKLLAKNANPITSSFDETNEVFNTSKPNSLLFMEPKEEEKQAPYSLMQFPFPYLDSAELSINTNNIDQKHFPIPSFTQENSKNSGTSSVSFDETNDFAWFEKGANDSFEGFPLGFSTDEIMDGIWSTQQSLLEEIDFPLLSD